MASDRTWADLRRRLAADGRALPPGTEPLWLEGYGPGGTALRVLCVSTVPSRTHAAVRSLFQEHGGHLGAPGSVAYLFRQSGVLRFAPGTDRERLAQLAYAAEAEDVVAGAGGAVCVLTAPACLERVRAHVAARGGGEPLEVRVTWRTHGSVPLAGATARQMLQLLLALESREEDVWSVYSNAQIPDEIVAQL